MYKGWTIKTSPCTATFNDLLCLSSPITLDCVHLVTQPMAVPWLRRLVVCFLQDDPALIPGKVIYELCWTKWPLGQVFSEYLCFHWPFSFHRLLHIYHLASGDGTIGQLVADVPSGLKVSTHSTKLKKKITELISRTVIFTWTRWPYRRSSG
jgi:hypothetical protein